MMYSVRIDKDAEDGYVFRVKPCEGIFEMVALDSTPAIIAFVHGTSPGDAARQAWEKGIKMHDKSPGQLESPASFLANLVSDRLTNGYTCRCIGPNSRCGALNCQGYGDRR